MKRTRKRKGGGWFDWIWKKPKTTLTKEDEKELIRMTKERTRPSVDVRTGEYRAVALQKRKPLGGGRRRSRRKRRRSRRRTRRKRRRRRTRRKRGGAPKWLKGVNTDYTWKDKSDWYVLPKKKTKIKGKRKSAAYPHFHGSTAWINFTFGGDDHIRLWSQGIEGVNAATLNRFLERLNSEVTDPPAEWDKIVEFLRTMVTAASPRKPKSPSALPPVRVSGPPPTRNPNQSWAANKGRQARAITPPSRFIVEQLREQREIQERKEAKRVAREAENRESLQRDEVSRQRKREIAAKEKKEIAKRAHEAAEIFGAGGWSGRLTDYRPPKVFPEGRSRSRFFATLGEKENRQTEEEKLLFDESAAAYKKVRAKFAREGKIKT